jgi:2-polyprenyl-6-methoxyphenol hydroxylase-like FAD-dependent oxidoreductase
LGFAVSCTLAKVMSVNDSHASPRNEDGELRTTCCVVGGGPAGIMLGYLLARSNVAVTVLEKHKDFFRDFRGDTVHPSTLELMFELGILESFLKLPHQQLKTIAGSFGDFNFQAADFRKVPSHCKFIALMPQWHFLNFLTAQATRYPNFNLRMENEAVDLLEEEGRIAGVKVKTPDGNTQIRADLVVACDGRHSTIRQAAKLQVIEIGVAIDVLWFRISRKPDDPERSLGNLNYGAGLVLINRADYYQTGLIIRKGSFEDMKREGLRSLQETVRRIAPYLGDRVNELKEWDQIKLLSVQINRLPSWYRPGLLCIGDAAHAMSPAGGVGINLAIQDAVAAANALVEPLKGKAVSEYVLARIQKRREFPTRVIQFVQANIHHTMARLFRNKGPLKAPWPLKVAVHIPGIQFALARAIGVGIRPEHIPGSQPPEAGKSLAMRVAIGAGIAAAFIMIATRKPSGIARARLQS